MPKPTNPTHVMKRPAASSAAPKRGARACTLSALSLLEESCREADSRRLEAETRVAEELARAEGSKRRAVLAEAAKRRAEQRLRQEEEKLAAAEKLANVEQERAAHALGRAEVYRNMHNGMPALVDHVLNSAFRVGGSALGDVQNWHPTKVELHDVSASSECQAGPYHHWDLQEGLRSGFDGPTPMLPYMEDASDQRPRRESVKLELKDELSNTDYHPLAACDFEADGYVGTKEELVDEMTHFSVMCGAPPGYQVEPESDAQFVTPSHVLFGEEGLW